MAAIKWRCVWSWLTVLFHRVLRKMLRWVPFVVFLHFWFKFKLFAQFFPFQNVIANLQSLSLSVQPVQLAWGRECVYVHRIKTSLKLSLHFFQCLFQKMVGLVAFEVSLCFLLKLKPLKMWRPMSLFMLLRVLLCVWKVIPYRKGMSRAWNVLIVENKYIYFFTWTVRKALNAISVENNT